MGKMNPLEKCEKCPDFIFEDVQEYIRLLETRNGAIEKALDEVFVLNDKQASIIRSLNSNNSQVRKSLQDNGFQTLEELLQAYSQVKRERDAAVNELVGTCQVCLWEETVKCATCHFNEEAWNVHESKWEWRGVSEGD